MKTVKDALNNVFDLGLMIPDCCLLKNRFQDDAEKDGIFKLLDKIKAQLEADQMRILNLKIEGDGRLVKDIKFEISKVTETVSMLSNLDSNEKRDRSIINSSIECLKDYIKELENKPINNN